MKKLMLLVLAVCAIPNSQIKADTSHIIAVMQPAPHIGVQLVPQVILQQQQAQQIQQALRRDCARFGATIGGILLLSGANKMLRGYTLTTQIIGLALAGPGLFILNHCMRILR